jgi:hypothetical protein
MATKLTADQAKRIGAISLTVKTGTVEEATKKLVEFLASNDVAGVEGDPINDLIEMAEVFYEPAPVKDNTSGKIKDLPETQEEIEEEDPETEDLDELAEEVVTQKIGSKKTLPAAAKTAAAKTKKTVTDGEKFDARSIPAHNALLQPFRDYFPADEFQIDTLKQGFTVRVLGKNAKTTLLNFDELKLQKNKELIGNFYTNRFKSEEDLQKFLPEAYQDREMGMFRGESHPSIRKITQTELFDIFENSDFITETLQRASGKDVTMGVNREKLEQTLKSNAAGNKKAAPVKSSKLEESEFEELEEEELGEDLAEEQFEEIEDTPPPVVKAKVTAKKTASTATAKATPAKAAMAKTVTAKK